MQNPTQHGGRWLWVPAGLCAIVGIFGQTGLFEVEFVGWLVILLPFVVCVALTAFCGKRHPIAGAIGLSGAVLMASISWWEKLERQTEGFEWQFNNALGSAMACEANYFVLGAIVCVLSIMAASQQQGQATP